jgi:hypothetical protein
MGASVRSYRYVGPADIRAAAVRADTAGASIGSRAEFEAWVRGRGPVESVEPFTYVVDLDGLLRLAPRRSEHVACAAGERVLAAGEMTFAREAGGWVVAEVSNQSTGYCPDVDSWPAVAAALGRAGLAHPSGFGYAFVFRRCTKCREHAVVKEDDFVCVFCGADLPASWNIDPDAVGG